MATTIKLKNGSGAPLAGDLVAGEPALDLTNKRLYTEDSGGTVIEVGTNPSTIDINAGTIDGTVIGGSSAAAGTFTTFTSTGIDDNATSTAITIDSSGNLGLGNNDPSSYSFDTGPDIIIGGGTDNPHLSIVSPTTGTGYVAFADGTTGNEKFRGLIEYAHTTDHMVFRTAGLGRMLIDAGGSVLIGKTTPTDLHDTWNHLIIGEKGAIISENGAGGIDGITLTDNAYIDADTGTYAYQTTAAASKITQSGGVTTFSNAASGTAGTGLSFTEAMRITSSGNVGIGETNPDTRLHVTGTTSDYGILAEQPSGYAGLSLKSTTVNQTWSFLAQDNGSNSDLLLYGGSSAGIKMTIDSSGNLLVGQTTVSLTTAGVALLPTGELYVVRDSGATAYFNREGSDGDVIVIRNDNVTVGSISVSGSTTSYNPSSDVRLKENIRDYDNALADVMKLKPRKYSWKTDGAEDSGFIAQELMETPEFANRVNPIDDDSDDPMYGVDYMKFVAVLTGAIQEQQVMIEELKAEVAALKGA